MKKLVIITTKSYDVPYGRIGNIFVGIISVDLDVIRNHQCNTERVIVIQTVILQRVSGVYGARNIRDRIDLRL